MVNRVAYRWPRWRAAASLLAITALAVSACSSSASTAPSSSAPQSAAPASAAPASAAPATTVTLWSESTLEPFFKGLAEAYNASHPNHIDLTLIEKQSFVPRVAAASAGGELPDLLATDLIYMPDFINQGLFQPITDQLNAYPKKADLAQAYIDISTGPDGQIYGAPIYADASSMFWNKDLFKKAGLDPEKGPTSWAEVAADAAKIRALGGDIYGYYFAGACAGCYAYTFLPQIWASGGDVINYTTHTATATTDPVVKEAYQYYADLWTAGVVPPAAKAENGSTWSDTFATGNVGIAPGGAFFIPAVKAKNPSMNFGVTGLPGKTAGQTGAFAGGYTIAITKNTKNAAAAWDFIQWTFSDEAQIEVMAKLGYFTSRIDLADNKYSKADPLVVANNKLLTQGARVPKTLGYNEIFNDINGPWLASITQAVFGGDMDGGLKAGQDGIQTILDKYYK